MKIKTSRSRELLAQEAARIMAEESVRDYYQAKQKACSRLGVTSKSSVPSNEEIHRALESYLALFKGESQTLLIEKRRRTALEVMQFLAPFQPKLVGAVLNGTADESSAIHLHVFADPEEMIIQFLLDKKIQHELGNRAISYCNHKEEHITVCKFSAVNTPIELSLFNNLSLREAPKSPVTGKPMRRASAHELESLLEQ